MGCEGGRGFWHTFNLTHNPHTEDFPVMPVERVSVQLKPAGFFESNPALDVPASNQAFNRSVLRESPRTGSKYGGPCCSGRSLL